PIDAVEVELNPWKLDPLRGGLLARCTDRGIRVLAHRPLGGPNGVKRAMRDKLLRTIAARHEIAAVRDEIGSRSDARSRGSVIVAPSAASRPATPTEVVLAWVRSLSPQITVLPGATRLETLASAIRGQELELDDDAKRALAAYFVDVSAPKRSVPRGTSES